MFFELNISDKDRIAGRFIGAVRKQLLRAAVAEKKASGITQQAIAKKIGVNRSVIHRMLKGEANLTLRSVAEIAWALGYEIDFSLRHTVLGTASQTASMARSSEAPAPIEMKSTGFTAEELSRVLKNQEPIKSRNDNNAPVLVAA